MKAVSFQVLFVLRVLCLVTLAGGQPKAPLKCSTECGRFTPPIAEKRIRSYRRTEPLCSRQAVIFITLKSLEICADPDAPWVKKILKKLDQKKAATSPLPRDTTSAVAPEEPGGFQKQVGLTVTAPSQNTAPSSFFQGTGTSVLERIHVPAARMEASSKSTPAMQDTTQLPGGSSPVTGEVVAHSEVTPAANRDSLKSPAPPTVFAAGMVSSQFTPYPKALVHGFDKAVGSTAEPAGHSANAMADVQDTTSPASNSDHVAITKEIATVPATPVPPETTSVSTLNSTTAIDKGPSVLTNKVVSSFIDAFGTRPYDYSSPVGKEEPSDTLVFTNQELSGQARARMTTERPNNLPLPSFLSRSQMHFVIPVSVAGGLVACSVAFVWLYLKFGVKPEEKSREMVQGLLYQQSYQKDVYPMEII
uniref:Chemokine interleukin-8-like domain-containing protein n=1 Tax=Calidris pygmaea TaxID=425635 RepID=A0A8C3PU70_9CHAR